MLMYRSERKTAPKVRSGRVQKKNRWEHSVDADDKLLSLPGITFEARSPGPGRRHVVTEIDVQRFVRCIPDWEFHSEGLKALVLANDESCLGKYDHRGIIYLSSWEEDLFWECDPEFFDEHEPTLLRLGVPRDARHKDAITIYFDEISARAFQLVHIFLHELGHHRDQMTLCNKDRRELARQGVVLAGSEEFAESWALRMEEVVWPRYKEFFGLPGKVRVESANRALSANGSASLRPTSEADDLLARARGALKRYPHQSLELTEAHALHYPHENTAVRETIAIQALVRLGRLIDAEQRAKSFVQHDPSRRTEIETVLGRPLS
jgi:hypothetical protein